MSEEEYQRSLKAVVQKIRTAMTIKTSLERHIQLARKTGRNDLEIGDDIRKELKGQLPDDTIRKYLPASLKHQEKTNVRYAGKIPHHPELPDNNNKEVDIPKPKEYHREVEPYPPNITALPPLTEDQTKRMHELMETNPHKVTLNMKKFEMDIRTALANKSNLELTINNNEVVKIKEI